VTFTEYGIGYEYDENRDESFMSIVLFLESRNTNIINFTLSYHESMT